MNVLVLGLPGSGKSYFAERLAKRLDAEYVSSDRLRKQLFPEPTYSDLEKANVYYAMLKKMQETNAQERNLVLDATFHKKSTRQLFTKTARGKTHFIEVCADEAIIKDRLKKSRPDSDADYQIHQLIKQQWEALEAPHLTLKSTNENIEALLQRALEYLKNDQESNR
ncbi:ATP-binding protein [Pricia sp. S334]|uniref:ATP-binding protein n=1 Tax=Pricia mediterranea TaxID=3076079 RepID=A0ABU3L917_9FLAO|nr:ATP-binding protein [Pricia sp. S334]MDT7830058.1 ATP-binding protein [Pricia sp. S334]